MLSLVEDKFIEGLDEMAVLQWGMCYPHHQKIPKYCPTASSGGFKYGTTVVWKNSVINPFTKGSAPGSIT